MHEQPAGDGGEGKGEGDDEKKVVTETEVERQERVIKELEKKWEKEKV